MDLRVGNGSAAGGTHSAAASRRQAARRPAERRVRGLICANCRARKVRCEGSQPACKTCLAYHDECRYEKPPPMSQILAMAKRLQEAEDTIARLQASAENTSSPAPSRSSAVPPESLTDSGLLIPSQTVDSTSSLSLEEDVPRQRSESCVAESSPRDVPLDLSLDKNGEICYYGPTSAVHEPPSLDSPSPKAARYDATSNPEARSLLVSKSKEWRMWEDFALRNAASQSNVPRSVIAKLLQIHWTWISPMFMWVYRPAFMRDMAAGGQYYSEFLLVVLCAHASRYTDPEAAEMLISRARMLLGSAIHQPSSIPTVQALLQLSGRDLAYGSISQAWLYSGMAFRMARDLGLHHSGPINASLRDLEPVDIEVRRRLFWSCYFWDKAVSLYTGRMPALTELPDTTSLDFLDDSSESEIWSPFCTETFTMAKLGPGEYPPMKSHMVSCFVNSCKISVIINDIILRLYSRSAAANTDAALKQITAGLHTWRTQSPAHLRYDPDDLPEICPPPHILCQNLLYYTAIILVHRPFWAVSVHYRACVSAAESIEKLLLLFERTFGFDNITYLMAYCIYTGAVAILQHANQGSVAAGTRLQTFTRALQSGSKRCPLLQRSLDIILKGRKFPAAPPASDSGDTPAHTLATPAYIPAFPYFGLAGAGGFDGSGNFNSRDFDSFSTLDCFPEGHVDAGSWYWPGSTPGQL